MTDQIDLTIFSGDVKRNDDENAHNCWRISDGNNLKVCGKSFCRDKSKVPAGKHLLDLVAVDWFKDTKRMDHVARRQGCAAKVASEKGLFCLVVNVQGSWLVQQSVGSTPCLLGKAVDCNYIRGPNYLEVDVDIGSSTVANGVLGLVFGMITTLVVDMAFLVQVDVDNGSSTVANRVLGLVFGVITNANHLSEFEIELSCDGAALGTEATFRVTKQTKLEHVSC